MENQPTHYVYHVTDRQKDGTDEKAGFWTKIGAAWPHKDGKGLSISIVVVPFDGRLVVRERPEEEQAQVAEAEVAAA